MEKMTFAVKIISMCLAGLVLWSCNKPIIKPELTGSIEGIVFDSATNNPISNVQVTTNPPSSSILTDKTGKFDFPSMNTGDYVLTLSKNGYQDKIISISVSDSKVTQTMAYMDKQISTSETIVPPSNPIPKGQSVDQPISMTLTWSYLADSTNGVTYDVYLYKSDAAIRDRIASNLTDTTLNVSNLSYNTLYKWEVVAKKGTATANSDVWTFKTLSLPQLPYLYASNEDGDFEIYIADSTATGKAQLTNNSYRDWWPRFSPDRKKIAFTSDETIEPQIYTMNPDGTNHFQVTTVPITGYNNYGIGFCWAPNSRQLYYPHNDKLYRIDADGTNLTLIATAPSARNFKEVNVSSKGDKIVALTVGQNVYDSEIYIMDSDGKNMHLLVGNQPGLMDDPSFSVDGTKVMYTYDVSGYEASSGRQLNSDVFLINVDGTGNTNVTSLKDSGTNDLYPRFSPDGAFIIFTNQRNDGLMPPNVFIMNSDGTNRKQVIINGQMPDWR